MTKPHIKMKLRSDMYSSPELTDEEKIMRSIDKDPTGLEQHAPGAKLDSDKVDMTLLLDFSDALIEVARVGEYGARKYTRGGWKEVPDAVRRYTAAMIRHLFCKETYDFDPWMDTKAGEKFKGKVRHDAQVAWNALARVQKRLEDNE